MEEYSNLLKEKLIIEKRMYELLEMVKQNDTIQTNKVSKTSETSKQSEISKKGKIDSYKAALEKKKGN